MIPQPVRLNIVATNFLQSTPLNAKASCRVLIYQAIAHGIAVAFNRLFTGFLMNQYPTTCALMYQ